MNIYDIFSFLFTLAAGVNETIRHNITANLIEENQEVKWGWGGTENLVNWPE